MTKKHILQKIRGSNRLMSVECAGLTMYPITFKVAETWIALQVQWLLVSRPLLLHSRQLVDVS